MNRYRSILPLFVILSMCVALTPLIAAPGNAPSTASAQPSSGETAIMPADGEPATTTVMPLPRGCGSVTPPGQTLAACCISGFVYIDGEPVAGAEVTITSPRNAQVVLYTQVYSGTESRPFYQLSLSAEPLVVQSGETITVTARYGGHERRLTYTVQPGSQQVDVVLARKMAFDYALKQTIPLISGPGTFQDPAGIAVNAYGIVYLADTGNHRIQVFTGDGVFLRQWGSYGRLPGQFKSPTGVAVDASLNVYVVDSGNARIQKFDSQGRFLTEWSSCGGFGACPDPYAITVGPDGGIAVLDVAGIRFFSAVGVLQKSWSLGAFYTADLAIDQHGYVYVTEHYPQQQVRKYAPSGSLVLTWGAEGTQNGQFSYISDVEVDASGDVWVTDNQRIQRFSSSGVWKGSWSTFAMGFSGNLAIAPNGAMYLAAYDTVLKLAPTGAIEREWGGLSQYSRDFTGVAVNLDGSILLVNQYPARVFQFDGQGRHIRTWTGDPPFAYLTDIATAPDGSVYVLDGNGHRVYKFTSDGAQLLTFGSSGSGPGQMVYAFGLAVDPAGNVFVADSWGNRVLKFSPSGQFITSWGSTGSAPGQFNLPGDIATDSLGNVYVADFRNNRVQKFTNSGAFISSSYMQLDGIPMNVKVDVIKIHGQSALYYYDYYMKRFWRGSLLSWAYFGWFGLDGESTASWAVDGAGAVYTSHSRSKRLQIFRPMNYTRPIATINHIAAPSIAPGETVVIRGMGQDSDETPAITAYRWTSSKNGVIGTQATLTIPAAHLSPGSHIITLEVQDSEGEWSLPVSTSIYIASPPQVVWTALLYLAGDYEDRGKLFRSFTEALAALQTSLRNPAVRVAAQVDGPADGDTYRLLIIPGNPPQVTRLENLGEKAMDAPATLSEFVRWGQSTFPAQNYYLAIANHGQGIQGIAWDMTSDLKDDNALNGSAYLTVAELGQALRADGIAPLHVVHLDACSMNMLEVAYELRPAAEAPIRSRLLIASQYLGWSYFPYDEYVNAIGANSTPEQAALTVTDIYARRASRDALPYTIAALDLGRVETVAGAVDNLAAELMAYLNNDRTRFDAIDAIWRASPHLESNGDYLNNELDLYVDLLSWVSRIQLEVPSPAVKQRAFELINELTGVQSFILPGSNRVGHGHLLKDFANGAYIDLSGARGVSIFYPGAQNSEAFVRYINNRLFAFTSATRWADFLNAGVKPTGPGPRAPLPGPLTTLSTAKRVYLPLVIR